MNKIAYPLLFAAIALTVMVTVPGCSKPSPDFIRKSLSTTGEQGTAFGLKKWAQTQPDSAKETANALKDNINNVLLPYLNGSTLPSSAEIQAFINSSLFKNVPDSVKEAIILASLALDSALPIPGSDTYLDADQLSYIKSFLTGVSTGCDDFLGTKDKDMKVTPNTTWLK